MVEECSSRYFGKVKWCLNRWVKRPSGETSSLEKKKNVDNLKSRIEVRHTAIRTRDTGTLVFGAHYEVCYYDKVTPPGNP